MSSDDLLDRLFLYCDAGDSPKGSPFLKEYAEGVRPIVDVSGRTIGRATLVDMFVDQAFGDGREHTIPREFRAPVCVTAGGFRSDEHWNFCGVVLGKPSRASRSSSKPIVFSDPLLLADWATEQAEIVAARSNDPIVQSRYAGLIQAIGGRTGRLAAFRFRERIMSVDQLASEPDLPNEIELKSDDWGVANGPKWDLTQTQLGVSTGKMNALFDAKLESDPRQRSQHRFWRQFWPSLWAAAIEAIAKSWGVPLDAVLKCSNLSYESHIPFKDADGRRGITLTSDTIRRPVESGRHVK
ncbi:MAG TPA: hypothetical protein PLY87_28005 [Planctomycetaceae bacterium]|nr:hypothetical protein [Planctomycetaceae bacterium]